MCCFMCSESACVNFLAVAIRTAGRINKRKAISTAVF